MLRAPRPAAPRASGRAFRGTKHRVVRAAPSDVFVFDFDGVLVDSEPEVTQAGVRAAAQLWPSAFPDGPDAAVQALQEPMRELRPVLVDGYETMVMAHLLASGKSVEDILADWQSLLAGAEAVCGASKEEMVLYLEKFRQEQMQQRPEEYLQANKAYKGVVSTLRCCQHPFYIASSKHGSRVSKLTSDLLGIPGFENADSPRLLASLLPPNEKKAEALRGIMRRPLCQEPATTLHFIDDRIETLLYVAQQSDLGRWKLYFANWGYSTEPDKQVAAESTRVTTVTLSAFEELVKWGVVMGVDDGCEPEEWEKQEMIEREHGLSSRK